jgi:hypothetical protein
MTTRNVGVSRFLAATSATVITAVSAWAFVDSTASIERDPFRFAATMAAHAKVHVAQVQIRAASTCPNNPEARDPLAKLCLSG